MYATIQPVPGFPTPATTLQISNVTVFPGASAAFVWQLLDAPNGAPRASGNLSLEGEAYAAWGTDDDYLYTYTATALGLTIVEIVPDAPPAPPVDEPAPVVEEPAPVDAPAAPVAPSDEAAPAVDGGTDE
jgi:hypothetical protein